MIVHVKFFASFKAITNTNESAFEFSSPITVTELKRYLIEEFPGLNILMPNSILAINRKFAADDDTIQHNDEVAIFPPVSGGDSSNTHVEISESAIDISPLLQRITYPTTGGVCVFMGNVREISHKSRDDNQTTALEYEAYLPMAVEKLHQVAEEIRQRWKKVEGIVIVQRVGYIPKGEQTIMVACSAGHRDDGIFEAARYGIDRVKEIVPVWKKEISLNGGHWKDGDYHPTTQD